LDLCCSQWPRHSPFAECVLSPVERAVFLLRELIEYGYDEIAAVVGKSEPMWLGGAGMSHGKVLPCLEIRTPEPRRMP
jgi:hypothetical protein